MKLGSSAPPPATLRQTLPKLGDRRPLGETGLLVSPFCLGMVADPAIIPAAFDAGVNFFFLSGDMSWHYFEKARRGLAMLLERGGGIRDDIVLSVGTYLAQPEYCNTGLHEVIRLVPGVDRVDVAIIGATRSNDFYLRLQDKRSCMRDGRFGVRAIGASFEEPESAVDAVNHALVDLAVAEHNCLARRVRDEVLPNLDAGAKSSFFGHSSKNGAPTPEQYAKLGLDEGSWIPGPVDHYRYALTHARLDGVLFAMGGIDYLEELIAGLEEGPLDEEELAYMSDLGDVVAGRASLEDDEPAAAEPAKEAP